MVLRFAKLFVSIAFAVRMRQSPTRERLLVVLMRFIVIIALADPARESLRNPLLSIGPTTGFDVPALPVRALLGCSHLRSDVVLGDG